MRFLSIRTLLRLGLIAAGVLSIATMALAFTEPASAPPAGDVPAPINVGSVTQAKSGFFTVGGSSSGIHPLDVYQSTNGYGIVATGNIGSQGDICTLDSNGTSKVCLSNASGGTNYWKLIKMDETFGQGPTPGVFITAPLSGEPYYYTQNKTYPDVRDTTHYYTDIEGYLCLNLGYFQEQVPLDGLPTTPSRNCISSWSQIGGGGGGGGGVSGSGTTNYVAKFTGASAIGNSSIFDNGNVGIGTGNPATTLDVSGGGARILGGVNWGTLPTSGAGLELDYNTSNGLGYVAAYDRSASAWKYLELEGGSLILNSISGGFVGIGMTPSGNYRLEDAGSVGASDFCLNNGSGRCLSNVSGGASGVSSVAAGTGISVSSTGTGGTGAVTVTNAGITSLSAGTNITFSSGCKSNCTGAVTINATGSGVNYWARDNSTGILSPLTTTDTVSVPASSSGNAVTLKVAGRIQTGDNTNHSGGVWLDQNNDAFIGQETGTNGADNQVGIYTGTNSKWDLTVTQNGNVGIGTTNPIGNLDIENGLNTAKICLNANCITSWPSGGSGVNYWARDNSTGILSPLTTTDTVSVPASSSGNAVTLKVAGRIQTGDNTNHSGGVWLDQNNDAFIGQETGTNGADNQVGIYTGTNSKWDLTVTQNGNVGIGTANPKTLLSTGGGITTIKVAAYDDGTGSNLYGMGVNSGELTFGAGLSSAGAAPQMVLTNGGNVGIGTVNPTQQLQLTGNELLPAVVGDTNGNLFFGGNTSQGQAGLRLFDLVNSSEGVSTPDSSAYIDVRAQDYLNGNNGLIFRVDQTYGQTEVMRITNHGNVGIGTNDPPNLLTVNVNEPPVNPPPLPGSLDGSNPLIMTSYGLMIQVSGDRALALSANGPGTNPDGSLNQGHTFIQSWHGRNLALNPYGNEVDFGSALNNIPQMCFYLSGSTGCYTSVSQFGTVNSDRRLKTNIQPITDSISKIDALAPVTFNWINPSIHGATSSEGFIAQDVQKVFPEFVTQISAQGADKALVGSDGNEYAINLPAGFDAYLVGAIQELSQRISVEGASSAAPSILSDYQKSGAPAISIDSDGNVRTAGNITAGSPARPSGITLYDDADGAPYCAHMHQGQLISTAGACPSR